MIRGQLKLVDKVHEIKEENGQYTVETSCGCVFNTSMLLPCRHMFALRYKLQEPLFAAELCDKRWTAEYYWSTQRMFSVYSAQSSLQLVTSSKEHRRKLSQHQKFRKASLITAELASVASGVSGVHFERCIKLLKELVASWKENEEVREPK